MFSLAVDKRKSQQASGSHRNLGQPHEHTRSHNTSKANIPSKQYSSRCPAAWDTRVRSRTNVQQNKLESGVSAYSQTQSIYLFLSLTHFLSHSHTYTLAALLNLLLTAQRDRPMSPAIQLQWNCNCAPSTGKKDF